MKDYRIESATALADNHSIKVRWNDGLEGVIDMSPYIEKGGVFTALRDPERFRDVRLYEYGHTLYWLGEDGSEIDLCPDVLRAKVDPEVAAWIEEQERRWTASQRAAE